MGVGSMLLAYMAWFVPSKEQLTRVPAWLKVASLQCHVEGVYGAGKVQLLKMPHTLGVAAACHVSCLIWERAILPLGHFNHASWSAPPTPEPQLRPHLIGFSCFPHLPAAPPCLRCPPTSVPRWYQRWLHPMVNWTFSHQA